MMTKKARDSSGTSKHVKPRLSTTDQLLISKRKHSLVAQLSKSKRKHSLVDHGGKTRFFCGICFDFKPVSDRFTNAKCDHAYCIECISKYVATQIGQNIIKVICPFDTCDVKLRPKHLRGILPDEVIGRWESLKCESLIPETEKTYCPFKDCSVLLVNDERNVVTSAECPSCHRLFCAQCRVPWHGDKTCDEFQNVKGNNEVKDLDDKFFNLAKDQKWQKCLQCSMFVQRNGGCEHMTCRCGCKFCYHCGKKWRSGHLCKHG